MNCTTHYFGCDCKEEIKYKALLLGLMYANELSKKVSDEQKKTIEKDIILIKEALDNTPIYIKKGGKT